ncbi:MAG: flagellar basal body-associated FliL family protein [Deltaproteobacteria bacterium]|nr:flagellar basal body-associated FliL family protein [Deltaproteobacteria bacterium]
MADEPEKNGLEAEEPDDDSLGELDLDFDGADGQDSRTPSEKVELDTAGLELDDLEEEEPEVELEPEKEEEGEEEEELEEEEKSGRPKWFWPVVAGGLFIILALLVLVVGRYTFLKEEVEVEVVEVEAEPQVAASVEEPAALPEAPPLGAPLVGLDHFLVPLDRPDRTVLRVSISLELASESSRAVVLRKTTLVRDIVFRVLEVKGQGDLKSKEARQTMRQRIKQEVNLKLEGGPVLNVYFTEFLIL